MSIVHVQDTSDVLRMSIVHVQDASQYEAGLTAFDALDAHRSKR